ncbi:MAG TPA: hypothetical protein VKZ53_17640 [Candidatus Angelobacter sp.]|nr:hypothetical protein [Candidatus Angelobacter sp.]
MKKLTLFKFMVAAVLAFSLYSQETPAAAEPAPAFSCPPICGHLLCATGPAFCNSKGQCVCPG